jgi:hypothetical protein
MAKLKKRPRKGFNLLEDLKERPTVLLILGLVIGAAVVFALTGVPTSKETITSNVVALYQVSNPGVEFQVLEVQKVEDLYAVALQAGELQFVTFVTPDGKYVVQNPTAIAGFAEAKETRDEFIQCMADQGVQLYGSLASNVTIQQIQLLGGPAMLEKIYISCDNEMAQHCIDSGIQTVPTWIIGDQPIQGVLLPEQLIQATGCEL